MAPKPKPNTERFVKLPRSDEPRRVKVISVNIDDETMMVEYPNTTSRIALMGDLRERLNWDVLIE